MLVRLDISREDRWTALFDGFRVLHAPVSSAIFAAAGSAAHAQFPGAELQDIQDRTLEITKFVARSVIRDWEGPVDDATGEALACTPENIDLVMDIFPVFRSFSERVLDARLRIEREKKDLPTLQSGTSGSGPDIAPTATGPAPTAPVA